MKVALVRAPDAAPAPPDAHATAHPAPRHKPSSLLPDDIDSLAAAEKAGHGARKAAK